MARVGTELPAQLQQGPSGKSDRQHVAGPGPKPARPLSRGQPAEEDSRKRPVAMLERLWESLPLMKAMPKMLAQLAAHPPVKK